MEETKVTVLENTETEEKKKTDCKKFDLFKNNKNLLILLICVLAVVILIVSVVLGVFVSGKSEKADTKLLVSLLEESSEMTSAKLRYKGITHYKDSGIALINRSDFLMVYEATVRAGIDLKDVTIAANDVSKTITVTIPKATIQEVVVDTDTIEYYDEKFSLFNANEKEDGNEAISLAQKSAKEEAAELGVLDFADKHSATLVKGILANAIPDGYTIEIEYVTK